MKMSKTNKIKKTKKNIGVLALLLAVLFLLSACSGGNNDNSASGNNSAGTGTYPGTATTPSASPGMSHSSDTSMGATPPAFGSNSQSAGGSTVSDGTAGLNEPYPQDSVPDRVGNNTTHSVPNLSNTDPNGESYLTIDENRAINTAVESMLTFSLKVDTAAYTNISRYIESGNQPPRDAVRTEELINYFKYDSQVSFEKDAPLGIYTEVGTSPFNKNSYTALIRVKSREIDRSELPPSNLTFLIDTSGSMNSYEIGRAHV